MFTHSGIYYSKSDIVGIRLLFKESGLILRRVINVRQIIVLEPDSEKRANLNEPSMVPDEATTASGGPVKKSVTEEPGRSCHGCPVSST